MRHTNEELLADLEQALELLTGALMDPSDPRYEDWRGRVEEFLKPRWPEFWRRNAG